MRKQHDAAAPRDGKATPPRGGRQTELSDALAEALGAVSGKKREAVDENADRETGSPGALPPR